MINIRRAIQILMAVVSRQMFVPVSVTTAELTAELTSILTINHF